MDYDLIEHSCAAIGLDYNAAECHGILCGQLCANPGLQFTDWLQQLDQEADETADQDTLDQYQQALAEFFGDTVQQLAATDFSFQPFLPDDETALGNRTQALTDWCQGFLYGIGSSQLSKRTDLPDHINEILYDLTEISRASHSDADDNDEDEAAYLELVEYIRGVVMLLHTELQHALTASTNPRPTVH